MAKKADGGKAEDGISSTTAIPCPQQPPPGLARYPVMRDGNLHHPSAPALAALCRGPRAPQHPGLPGHSEGQAKLHISLISIPVSKKKSAQRGFFSSSCDQGNNQRTSPALDSLLV